MVSGTWAAPCTTLPWGQLCSGVFFSGLLSLSLQIQLKAFATASSGMLGEAGVFLKSR